MLRTNLATRPFYNERLVRAGLVAVAALGAALLAAGLVRLSDLARRHGELRTRIERADRAVADLATRAAGAQRALSPQDRTALADATREVDVLMTRRGFSWIRFLNRIETTLPPDAMVTEIRPEIEPGTVDVALGVLGRSLDSIDRFVTALEASGAFVRVLNRQVDLTEDGAYQAVLRGRYLEGAPDDDPQDLPARAGEEPPAPPESGPGPPAAPDAEPAVGGDRRTSCR